MTRSKSAISSASNTRADSRAARAGLRDARRSSRLARNDGSVAKPTRRGSWRFTANRRSWPAPSHECDSNHKKHRATIPNSWSMSTSSVRVSLIEISLECCNSTGDCGRSQQTSERINGRASAGAGLGSSRGRGIRRGRSAAVTPDKRVVRTGRSTSYGYIERSDDDEKPSSATREKSR